MYQYASILFLILSTASIAKSDPCSGLKAIPAQLKAVQALQGKPGFWNQLHQVFVRMPKHCDDVEIATAFQELVAATLEQHWNSVGELLKIRPKDNAFEKFVITAGTGEEAGTRERFESLIAHARKQCPRSSQEFCRKLSAAAQRSLSHLPECAATYALDEKVTVEAKAAESDRCKGGQPHYLSFSDGTVCVRQGKKIIYYNAQHTLTPSAGVDLHSLCQTSRPTTSVNGAFYRIRGDVPDNDEYRFRVDSLHR